MVMENTTKKILIKKIKGKKMGKILEQTPHQRTYTGGK